MAKSSLIGKAIPRVDALAKVTGQTAYIIDTIDRGIPSSLVGLVLRSPLPHARIKHLDTTRAAQLPGVVTIITSADFPGVRYGGFVKDLPVLAEGKVRYIGERVAAVAAIDRETAQAALDLIEVEYEELTPILDPLEALQPGAPRIHEDIDSYRTTFDSIIKYDNVCSLSGVRWGNVEEGFAKADHIFEDTFTTPMVHQAYLEPHACIAQTDVTGRLTMWTTTPSIFLKRDALAEILRMPSNMLKLIPGPLGGSFGGKNDLRLEPLCARLAQKSGRAVRMTMDRDEEFADGGPRHAAMMRLKAGVMNDGTIVARQARLVFDTGAYAEFGPAVASEAAKLISGPYRVPNLDVESLCVYTNKTSCGCFRAHGAPEPTFAYESQMDIIAARLGIDPVALRLKNAVVDGDHSATGEIYSNTALSHNLRRVADRVEWASRTRTANRGRGIASGQWHTGGRPGGVILKLDEHGKLTIATGTVDVTGSDTVLSQIAAEELGIPLSDVQILPIDTDQSPFDSGSSGTRTVNNVGGPVRESAIQIRGRLLDLAAGLLEANPDDLKIEDGRIFVEGAQVQSIPVARAARQSFRATGGAIVVAASTPAHPLPPEPAALIGLCFGGSVEYLHPVQCAEVEVDPETGAVKVLSLTSAHDIGKAINPATASGQVEGGVAQGLGYALSEELLVQDGQVLNPFGAPYLQPTAADVPPIDTVLLEDIPGRGPYGSRCIGETPIIATAPAIANAIYDAVGVRIKSLPITAEKIVAALREKEQARSD